MKNAVRKAVDHHPVNGISERTVIYDEDLKSVGMHKIYAAAIRVESSTFPKLN